MLEQITRELNVEALPTAIPESIVHDVGEMQIGDTIDLAGARCARRGHAAGRSRETVSRRVPAAPAEPRPRRRSSPRPSSSARARPRRPASCRAAAPRASPAGSSRPAAAVRRWRRGRVDWLIVGLGQSRARVRRHPSQHRVHGRRRAGRALGAGRAQRALPRADRRGSCARAGPGRRAGTARGGAVAADVHERGRALGGSGARRAASCGLERVVVVHDEIDMPFGEVRARLGGGLAGHNGLKSLRRELGSAEFCACAWASGGPTPATRRSSRPTCSGASARAPSEVRELIERAAEQVEAVVLGERAAAGRDRSSSDGAAAALMALRSLLGLIGRTSRPRALAREGGHAFVSASLRPYLIAALADARAERRRARARRWSWSGDDRAARDLAGDLRAWLCAAAGALLPLAGRRLRVPPRAARRISWACAWRRSTRCWPASERASRRHEPPVVVVSAVALSEKVPDPELRPRSFTLRVGELLDLEECAAELVGSRATSGWIRWRSEGSSRCEGDCWMSSRRPRSGPCGWTCSTSRSNRCAGSRPSRSARSATTQRGRDRARGRARRRASRAGRAGGRAAPSSGEDAGAERPDIAELLPVERFGALLELLGEDDRADRGGRGGARSRRCADHWTDVCAAFADEDAHHLYVSPGRYRAALAERARTWLSALSGDQPLQLRAQSADTAARSLAEAEPRAREARALGLPHGRRVPAPRRGRARRLQPRAPESRAGWGRASTAGARCSSPRCASPRRRCARGSSRPS